MVQEDLDPHILFPYFIVCRFGTDVMVTVAKSLDVSHILFYKFSILFALLCSNQLFILKHFIGSNQNSFP